MTAYLSPKQLALASGISESTVKRWCDRGLLPFVRTPGGRVFSTTNLESWRPQRSASPQTFDPQSFKLVKGIAYRAGANVWRSDDGGANWRNLTGYQGGSLLGGRVLDLAVDENSPDRIAVAAETGVWLSHDGGRSWVGLNDRLPNLAIRRLLAAPRGSAGVRAAILTGGRLESFQWQPGDGGGWLPVQDDSASAEALARRETTDRLGAEVFAAAASGDFRYAGGEGGRIWASQDGGISWLESQIPAKGRVDRFWVDPAAPQSALALIHAGSGRSSRVLRTVNGGRWWDDLTTSLGEIRIHGMTAFAPAGAVYLASDQGVFWALADLRAPAPPPAWQRLPGSWGESPVMDVILDGPGHLLLAAVEGEGLFSTLAPHRYREPALVDAADAAERAVAPGSLLSLLGGRAESATAQGKPAVILAAQDGESQIQLPYGLTGGMVEIEIRGRQGPLTFGRQLKAASPAIVVGADGRPVILDAESGLPLDALNPARGGMRLQILMSGLGRVSPDWPAGLAAPVADPPRVAAPLRALLDGVPVAVERASLAPGYTGYYLVELRLPDSLPPGAAELCVEASGESSNAARLYTSQ